jgi:metal-responsive CopG/Arc/MetJ family transcriptional regulator
MKTIQITINDTLLQRIDHAARLHKITRRQFIHRALETTLRQIAIEDLEQKQAEGYRRYPVTPGEFDSWE